jgi:hypothetical protein
MVDRRGAAALVLAVLGALVGDGECSGDTLSPLPKKCTLTKVTSPARHPNSNCYSDHWCHGGHNWCKAHDGKRTLEHGAPGCSDPASGGETGSLCDPKKVTTEYCAQVCWTWDRYPYSGATQMGDEKDGSACYCGDKMDKSGEVQPPATCSAPCAGGGTGMCGAPSPSWFINVMKLMPEGCEGLSAEEEGALTMDTLFSAAIVYLLVVSVYNQKRLKRRGWEVIPHAAHLKQLSELVQDGLKFSYAKVSGKISAGAVPTERTALLRSGSGKRRDSQASQASQISKCSSDSAKGKKSSGSRAKTPSKKEKKEKSSKEKHSKSKSIKSGRGEGRDATPLASSPAAPETAVEKQHRLLQEQATADPAVHSSQQKIKVVSLSQSVTL